MNIEAFNELLKNQVLIIDGAMGTLIQNLGYGPDVYGGEEFQMLSDILVLSRPDDLKSLHRLYFEAGAQAVETNTFGASPLRLAEFDFSGLDIGAFPAPSDGVDWRGLTTDELAYRLNVQAARIARDALEDYRTSSNGEDRPLFVIGSIGPSNWVLSNTHANLKKGEYEQIFNNFKTQVTGLIDGGVDILLFETQQDILELKVAVFGAQAAMRDRGVELPIIAQVTVDRFSRMQIFNTDILAALTTIGSVGIQAFGINCSLGPDLMEETVKNLSRHSRLPISVIPNAGLPQSENGRTVFNLSPESLAGYLKDFVDRYGVNIVGGCCGTTPDHIRAVRQAIGDTRPGQRTVAGGISISGPQRAIPLDSRQALIRIGERLNVRGSKKVRDAVEGSSTIDHAVLEEVVTEQVRDLGLEIIDVCMDSNVVDTSETLAAVIKEHTIDFPGAMSLDSFDVGALERAVQVYPGRPLINSISLEEYAPGVDKVDAVMAVTRQHAPVYIVLTTGPEGPAVTADDKVALAARIIDKALEYGVRHEQLIVDINAFPIGAEPDPNLNFALESIRAIPRLKQLHPDLKTVIGVGNLTNGLGQKPYMRKVLTSVFLDEARKNGLDAAIVNPNHYVPVEVLPALDNRLARQVILEHDMEAFAQLEEIAIGKKAGAVNRTKTDYDRLDPISSVCARIKDGYKQRETGQLTYTHREFDYTDRIVPIVAGLLSTTSPLDLINRHLMPAMEALGEGFADGMVSLPHLLKAADVMKQVMGFLEQVMLKETQNGDSAGIPSKGTVVLGTVYQDVHSIGKDLSKTLLENYGYRVIDLGVQVPVQRFIDAAKEHKAVAIGLSALLVQTSNHMITLSEMQRDQELSHLPLLIGGAPVNTRHAAFVAMAGQDKPEQMRDNVFYCVSGMDGVNILNQLLSETQRSRLLKTNLEKLMQAYQGSQKKQQHTRDLMTSLPRRIVNFEKRPSPAVRIMPVQKIEYPLSTFRPYLNEKLLFGLNWKFGGRGGWEKKGIRPEDLYTALQDWIQRAEQADWIRPQAVFAVFPCRGGHDQVTVIDPKTAEPLARLTFNDNIGRGEKDIFNIARFFNDREDDIIGLQLSTAGPEVGKAVRAFSEHDRESALMLQGLSDRIAEDMAAHVHQLIGRRLFGNDADVGARYSPGYPAMTDITNNRVIADLLGAVDRLGIRLTGADQFDPTGTTAAVICFHPEAGYH